MFVWTYFNNFLCRSDEDETEQDSEKVEQTITFGDSVTTVASSCESKEDDEEVGGYGGAEETKLHLVAELAGLEITLCNSSEDLLTTSIKS